MKFLYFLIAVVESTVFSLLRDRQFIPIMPVSLRAAEGSNSSVLGNTILTLCGPDPPSSQSRSGFLSIGPGSRIQRRHGSILVLNSSLVCGADREAFESACQPDSIVTAPFATHRSLLGVVSYGASPMGIPGFLIGFASEVISLETDGKLKVWDEIDVNIRATLSARGAIYNESGNSTQRYVSNCYPETIQDLPPLIVHLYNLPDPTQLLWSPGYRSGSIAIDVPITHDPSRNFCYLNYDVGDVTSRPEIPFLAIPGIIVYINRSHIAFCDGI